MNDIDLILMKYPYECDAELEQLFKELEKARKEDDEYPEGWFDQKAIEWRKEFEKGMRDYWRGSK